MNSAQRKTEDLRTLMARFEEYRDKYRHLRMQRNDGILEVMLHSDDGPVVWGAGPHRECGAAFGDIAADPGSSFLPVPDPSSSLARRSRIRGSLRRCGNASWCTRSD